MRPIASAIMSSGRLKPRERAVARGSARHRRLPATCSVTRVKLQSQHIHSRGSRQRSEMT